MNAKGRTRHVAGEMNKLEAEYRLVLMLAMQSGQVIWFGFEAITFKLAHDTRYTPDFAVQLADGTMELHEVKAAKRRESSSGDVLYKPLIEDDAKVKIQVAARLFPFVFKVCYKTAAAGWIVEEVRP